MKILVLNYEFPPVGGGGGHVSKDLAQQFTERGHDVRVLTARHGSLPKQEMIDGYEVNRIFAFRRFADRCSILEMALFDLLVLVPFLVMIRRWKPQVVHVHFAVPTGAVAWLGYKLTKTPYVLTVHLGDVPGAQPEQTDHLYKVVKPFTVPIWRGANIVTGVSKQISRLGETAYSVPVEPIPNSILMGDRSGVSEIRAGYPVKMVLVARFDPQKNIPFIIDVLSRLPVGDWQLDILGDGKEMSITKERLAEYDLSEQITLHGWSLPETVDNVMSASDILLMPSLYEGLSIVSLKALKYGLAIVASDIPGLREIVDKGINGILCAPNDHDDFEEALLRLIKDTEALTSMRRAGYIKASEFELSKIVDQYETVLERAIS